MDTNALASRITIDGSKQSYYSARFLADKECVDDALKAYAYFRWLDDYVDDGSVSAEERMNFIHHQTQIIDMAYASQSPSNLKPQEVMIKELIDKDRSRESKLHSYIHNMMAIIKFDAERKDKRISEPDLIWYSQSLSKAVIDNLQYFIGKGFSYPECAMKYAAAIGAHIAHMLRDMAMDLQMGYINIPQEYIDKHRFNPNDFAHPAMKLWVRSRVELARAKFQEGKRYFMQIPLLRYKMVCLLYCARYDGLLRRIERDQYQLRGSYAERYKAGALLRIAWMMTKLVLNHYFNNMLSSRLDARTRLR